MERERFAPSPFHPAAMPGPPRVTGTEPAVFGPLLDPAGTTCRRRLTGLESGFHQDVHLHDGIASPDKAVNVDDDVPVLINEHR